MQIDLNVLNHFESVIGCDEVGRGPIAGPVTGCAVSISDKKLLERLMELNITDSKKLTEKKRNKILIELDIDLEKIELGQKYFNDSLGEEFSFCVYEHTHKEIDEMNILQASLSAMKNASEKVRERNTKILIDGNKVFETNCEVEAVVKGDSKSIAIGLASIIAKQFRDEKMKHYDALYPGYNLAKHAGYPTKEHKDAVAKLGPSPIHRKSFKGVKEFL